MCIGCYDDYVKDEKTPVTITVKMREIAQTIREFYEDHPVGGALHIVLDDWNLSDDNIKWCIDNYPTESDDRKDDRVLPLANDLLALSEPQRYEVLRLARDY